MKEDDVVSYKNLDRSACDVLKRSAPLVSLSKGARRGQAPLENEFFEAFEEGTQFLFQQCFNILFNDENAKGAKGE